MTQLYGRRHRFSEAHPLQKPYARPKTLKNEPRSGSNGIYSLTRSLEKNMRLLPRVLAIALFSLVSTSASVWASDYPTRAIKWIVPYPPAGTTDVLARIMAQRLTETLGQSVVVENKPGAGNNIGTEQVINAAPDGLSLIHISEPTRPY